MPADAARTASTSICRALWKIDGFASARKIALYHSAGSEVQTHRLLWECVSRDITVLLPRVCDDMMRFHAVTGPGDLTRGRFGIMEPQEACPEHTDADVILVPAIGVTRYGHRLGYGRGYYDRYLSGSCAVFIALAYSFQVVDTIPHDTHDIPVHWIVTENDTIQASHKAA